MATTLEYDIKVQSVGLQYGEEAAEKFAEKLKKTQNVGEDLEASLQKQEARIKVLDGAINVLGGSVELAVGSVTALGLVSEENAEQFQAAALGAIAFADGAKRTFDGIKSLNEGLKSFGGVAGLARKAQLALNSAVLANPYVLAAAAVAALAAGLYLLATRETEEEAANRKALETAKLRLQNLEDSESRVLAFARAQGLATETVLQFEEASVKARIAEIDRILALEEDAEEIKRLSDEQNKLLDKEIELGLALGKVREDARQKEIEDRKKAGEDAKKAAADRKKEREDDLAAERKFLDDTFKAQQDYTAKLKAEFDQRKSDRQALADYEHELMMEEFNAVLVDLEKRKAAGQKAADDAQRIADAQITAREANFANLSATTAALGSLFEQGTAAFKAAAIADIAINIAQGYVNGLAIAQKSAQATGPAAAFAFPLFYASQIAAVLAAANNARKILATTPGGDGGAPTATKPSGGGASGGTPSFPSLGGGFQGLPAGTAPIGPAAGQEPIRAYVVSNDVTNGVQAQGQLRRRRRLGPG